MNRRIFFGLPVFVLVLALSLCIMNGQAEAGILQLTEDTSSSTIERIYPAIDLQGRVAWSEIGSDGSCNVKYYNGQTSISVGTGQAIETPLIDRGTVAWQQGNNNSGYKICLYNGQETLDLYNGSQAVWLTSLSNGQVAWLGGSNYSQLYFYNGQEIINLGETILSAPYAVSDGKVLWAVRNQSDNTYRLHYYDGAQTCELDTIVTSPAPLMEGDKILWAVRDGTGEYTVKLYDGVDTSIVATGTSLNYSNLSNGCFLYTEGDYSNGYTVYYYNGQSSRQIGSAGPGTRPNVTVDNGSFAWCQKNSEGLYEICYFDGTQVQTVGTTTNYLYNTLLSNGKVAWYVNSYSGNSTLWFYDSGQTQEITASGLVSPALCNGLLVWKEWVSWESANLYVLDNGRKTLVKEQLSSPYGLLSRAGKVVFTGSNADLYLYQPDGYRQWDSKCTSDRNKEWNIALSKEVRASSISGQSVYITDSGGNKLDSKPYLKESSIVAIPAPSGGYSPGTYYLYIETSLTSSSQDSLKEPVKMEFTIE
ncbi:MAG: hypothetical protein ABFD08_05770 [Syntrophomonas sp.]